MAYATAGLRTQAVGRELFLDGSTFRESRRVSREQLAGASTWGLRARVGRVAVEYRLVGQARTYRTGLGLHLVGAVTLTLLH